MTGAALLMLDVVHAAWMAARQRMGTLTERDELHEAAQGVDVALERMERALRAARNNMKRRP